LPHIFSRTCDEKHWSRLRVTPAVTVTKVVTPKTRTIAVPFAHCQLYEADIKRLKLALAKAHTKPVPQPSACARCAPGGNYQMRIRVGKPSSGD
jgi:hypothetical protein